MVQISFKARELNTSEVLGVDFEEPSLEESFAIEPRLTGTTAASTGEYEALSARFKVLVEHLDWVRTYLALRGTEAIESRWAQTVQMIISEAESRSLVMSSITKCKMLLETPMAILTRRLGLIVDNQVTGLLDSEIGPVIRRVLEIVISEKHEGLPLQHALLTKFTDPEAANVEEVVLCLKLHCDVGEALVIWERLSAKVDAVKPQFSPLEGRLLDEKIRLEVDWD